MTARIPKTISGPIRAERCDFDNGEIAYEIWDHGKSTTHLLCTIREADNRAAKAEAEFIALSINNTIGALNTVAAAEQR